MKIVRLVSVLIGEHEKTLQAGSLIGEDKFKIWHQVQKIQQKAITLHTGWLLHALLLANGQASVSTNFIN